jgi:hypothetical protein
MKRVEKDVEKHTLYFSMPKDQWLKIIIILYPPIPVVIHPA